MNKKMRFVVLGVMALAVITPFFAFALDPLVQCGTSRNPTPCSLCDLFSLTQTIITFCTMYAAPLIAVLVFAWGGFKILISGANPGYRQEGIKAIRNGVIGLLIVFSAWVVVNEFLLFFVKGTGMTAEIVSVGGVTMPWTKITCYPALPPPTPTTTVPPGGRVCTSNNQPITVAQINGYGASHANNYTTLLGAGIGVQGSGGICYAFDDAVPPDGTNSRCTSVGYLPNIDKLKALKLAVDDYCLNPEPGLSCQFVPTPYVIITGGTECAHKTHGFNQSKIDLNDNLAITNFIRGTAIRSGLSTTLPLTGCETYNIIGITFVHETGTATCASWATGPHWHVSY